MKVLVTNDDGYTSIGLKKLVEKIKNRFERCNGKILFK